MMENDRGHAWHGGVAPLSNSTGDPPYRPATYPPPVRIHSVDAAGMTNLPARQRLKPLR